MSLRENILDTTRLDLRGTFDMQVEYLLYEIRLTRFEVDSLDNLFRDLTITFQKAWPGCQVQPFGSVVTGLGIRTSDIDCYIALPPWAAKHDPGNIVMQAKRILRSQYQIYTEVFAIPAAKVPIVQFYHIPLGWHCDINFKSPAGVSNSHLISYLLRFDSRALPLAILIKYWSKIHKFTGTNLLANYALIMLVIFYLQQENILPPVYTLQNNMQHHIIDGWNYAFDKQMPYMPYMPYNDISLYQLLGGFFNYYCKFDFSENLVSPFLGKPVNRKSFEDVDKVPDEFSLYKTYLLEFKPPTKVEVKKMFIQDPFEHCRNCAVNVHVKLAERIQQTFQSAATSFTVETDANFLRAIFKTMPMLPSEIKHKKKKNDFSKIRKRIQKAKALKKQNIQNKNNALMLFGEYSKLIKNKKK